jgi:hypothetical protein
MCAFHMFLFLDIILFLSYVAFTKHPRTRLAVSHVLQPVSVCVQLHMLDFEGLDAYPVDWFFLCYRLYVLLCIFVAPVMAVVVGKLCTQLTCWVSGLQQEESMRLKQALEITEGQLHEWEALGFTC